MGFVSTPIFVQQLVFPSFPLQQRPHHSCIASRAAACSAAVALSTTMASDPEKYVVSEVPGSNRLKNVELKVPLVVGTYAYPLKKPEEFASHEWVVYVRSPLNEDISHIIQKAVFELHSTFTPPTRPVGQQPFEVKEKGWGEFDVGVTVSPAVQAASCLLSPAYSNASQPKRLNYIVKTLSGTAAQDRDAISFCSDCCSSAVLEAVHCVLLTA